MCTAGKTALVRSMPPPIRHRRNYFIHVTSRDEVRCAQTNIERQKDGLIDSPIER